jgi:hypothetical protein
VHLRAPFRYWKLGPSEIVARAVMAGMLRIPNDRITFEIIDNGDGRACVFAKYSLIIGDLYLAEIDASTIPGKGE